MANDDGDDLTIIAESRWFWLSQDEEGYSLWSVRGEVDEPLATFPKDGDGYERASAAFRRESRAAHLLSWLLWAAAAAGALWLAFEAWAAWLRLTFNGTIFDQDAYVRRTNWASAGTTFLNAVFFVAVGLYVVVWLERWNARRG